MSARGKVNTDNNELVPRHYSTPWQNKTQHFSLKMMCGYVYSAHNLQWVACLSLCL